MKIFHHNDSDGRCSAFWVKKAVELQKIKKDFYFLKFFELNYNIPFPIDEIKKDEIIFIVDFSVNTNMMDKILEKTKNVFWIDHHKTAIADYKNYAKINDIKGVQYSNPDFPVSGCALVYLYLFEKAETPEQIKSNYNKVPFFTKLISDYDIWKFEYKEKTWDFFYTCNSYSQNPEKGIWDVIFDSYENIDDMVKEDNSIIQQYIKEGNVIKRYVEITEKEYSDKYIYEIEFEGKKTIVLNRGGGKSSQVMFGDLMDKYDFVLTFVYDGKGYQYGIYSSKENVDVSEIAKKYKGGGHKGAAGFSSKEFLLKQN